MTKKVLLILVVSMLTSCAASNMTWYNSAVTNQQAQTDFAQCEYEASRGSYTPMGVFDSPISAGIQEGIQKASLMNKCMRAKGYYLADKDSVTRPAPNIHQTLATYDAEEVSWSKERGSASIHGNAFLRKQDGAIVSCAGLPLSLVPASSYANERISHLYGNLEQGRSNNSRQIDEGDPDYFEDHKTTICDVDGRFKFEYLPAGDYYLISSIFWGNPVQGGMNLMKKVSLSLGELEEITVSN